MRTASNIRLQWTNFDVDLVHWFLRRMEVSYIAYILKERTASIVINHFIPYDEDST